MPQHPLPQSDGHRYDGYPVLNVAPRRGFHLIEWMEADGDHFEAPAWAARGEGGDILLHASRFSFTPTTARFAWLVDNVIYGARSSGPGPWNDGKIDAAIADEAALEKVRCTYGRSSREFRAAAYTFAASALSRIAA